MNIKDSKEEKKMTINMISEDKQIILSLSGRLDAANAPKLEAELKKSINWVEKLVFDFKELDYISSAGLRVLLNAQKVMNKQGEMIVRNVNDTIVEVFEITGFVHILNIE